MPRSRRLAVTAGSLALVAALSGCSTTIHLEPADDANNVPAYIASVRRDMAAMHAREVPR